MTAKPDHRTVADEWRGEWVNFYAYRGGQQHFGITVSATREAADAVRAAYFQQGLEQAKCGFVLAYHIPGRETFWIPEKFDRFNDTHPIVAKARNCTFSIAIPYVPPEGPQDDDIPF